MKYPQNRYFLYAVISVLVILFLLSSCSCNYHLKQAEKKCGKTVIHDTLMVHDSIKINGVQTDTLFVVGHTTDTVYLNKDRLHIKYFKKDSLVYISGSCDTITVYRTIRVPYEKTTLNFDFWHWAKVNILWILLIAAILITGTVLIKRLFQL